MCVFWCCCAKVSETAFVCCKIAWCGRCPPAILPPISGPDVTMDDYAACCPAPRCCPCYERCVDKSTTQERLERLEAWKNKGLITQAAHDRRRAEIVALL